MRIQVESVADHRGVETPRRLHLDGRRVEIVECADQWDGADYRYFKVKGDDGNVYILRFDEPNGDTGTISIVAYSRRQLPANAAIAASRVGSWPWAARLTLSALCPLAHIHGRPAGAMGPPGDLWGPSAVLLSVALLVASSSSDSPS